MTYQKTKWISGETVVSAENLNKIESELERLGIKGLLKDAMNNFSFGECGYIREVNGDVWLTANAYFDDVAQQWMRVDEEKISFALELQGKGTIAHEVVPGLNMWKASPGPNPIGAVGTIGGWEILTVFTGHGNVVVGGMNFEIDGSGASPALGRIHQLEDGTYLSRDAYWDGSRFVYDKVTQPAVAIKIDNLTGELSYLYADKAGDTDIDYDGTGEAFPTIEFKSTPILTEKALSEKSMVGAYQVAPQAIPADTFTNILFDSVDYDNKGEFDASYGVFAAKEDGIYAVTTSTTLNGIPEDIRFVMTISVNGSEKSRFIDQPVSATGNQVVFSGSKQLKMSKGDSFAVYVYSSADVSTLPGQSLTNIEITKIA